MGCRDRGELWWLQPLGCFSDNFYNSENPKIVMVTTPWIIFYTSTEAYIKFFCTMLKNCLWLHHYIQIDTAKVIRHEILSYWISTMFSSIMMSGILNLCTDHLLQASNPLHYPRTQPTSASISDIWPWLFWPSSLAGSIAEIHDWTQLVLEMCRQIKLPIDKIKIWEGTHPLFVCHKKSKIRLWSQPVMKKSQKLCQIITT